ncbi:MAG: DUF523 and DUF1722 domain-containing protein [Gammaproteobacteria bacterium]|nr:DUF523 and DUF1722 domain-containing protein [Gammaproteobacteria bacterium]
MSKIKIGISSCLLGQMVRYDGGHKHSAFITDRMGKYFEFQPYCPEVAIGLGVPRPPIQLVSVEDDIRVRGIADSSADYTHALSTYGEAIVHELDDVCGYIFKKNSPSCGMQQVPVHDENNTVISQGAGIYAAAIMRSRPELPVEDEERLMNPDLCENFLERVFVMQRWYALKANALSAKQLIDFHRRHKFLIQAHDEAAYRELGRMISQAGNADTAELAQSYLLKMMQALKKLATRGTHANVLTHMLGFIKNQLEPGDKQALLKLIENYQQGLVSLIEPLTLLKQILQRYPNAYLAEQYYLMPYPIELMHSS